MPLDRLMSLALYHPQHGYYTTQSPFGRTGDFITAPEISQLFGETLAIWVVTQWQRLGRPNPCALVEIGGGRGTLMADMLRSLSQIAPDIYHGLTLHMIDISPRLRSLQAAAIKDLWPTDEPVQWHSCATTLPNHVPLIVIGNEVLDALPARQFYRNQTQQWHEQCAVVDGHGVLGLDLIACEPPSGLWQAGAGWHTMIPSLDEFLSPVTKRLQNHRGAACFIDYGYIGQQTDDMFQAVHKHRYVPLVTNLGASDITFQVPFDLVINTLGQQGISHTCVHFSTQGEFLQTYGITLRHARLRHSLGSHHSKISDLDRGLHRLIGPDEMGTLFKVLQILG
jgi:SAM-dependent MidA family methyltransferase